MQFTVFGGTAGRIWKRNWGAPWSGMILVVSASTCAAVSWIDTIMLNARSTFGVIIAAIALTLGAAGVITYYRLRFQEEHDPRLVAEIAAKRMNNQLDAITLAFLKKISRESQAISKSEVVAVCVAEDRNEKRVDARPEILTRLKKTIPKIRPYSYCTTLPQQSKYFIYTLVSFKQESDEDAAVGIDYRDDIGGIYHDGMIINMKKRDGKWEIGILGPGWIS